MNRLNSIFAVFLATSLLLISSNVQAKTQGNYLELSYIYSDHMSYVEAHSEHARKHHNDSHSFGVRYGYALNLFNFFIMPSVFYDHIDINADIDYVPYYNYQGYHISNLKYNYGVKIDFGYDFTRRFAAFINVNYGSSRHETGFISNHPTVEDSFNVHDKETFGIGIGMRYNLIENLSVIGSYDIVKTTSRFNKVSNKDDKFKFNSADDMFPADIHIGRLGLAYRF